MAGESARHKKVRQAVSNLVQLANMEEDEIGLPLADYRELDEKDKKLADQIAANLINLVDGLRDQPAPAAKRSKK